MIIDRLFEDLLQVLKRDAKEINKKQRDYSLIPFKGENHPR